MRIVHTGDKKNLPIYKKLLDMYENEDFSTKRTPDEKQVELEIITELSEISEVAQLIKDNPNNYLKTINNIKDKKEEYKKFLKTVKGDLKNYI